MPDIFDMIETLEKQASGGGGFVTSVKVAFGYKAFVSGTSNTESFFEFTLGDEKSQQTAKDAVSKFVVAHGGTAKPQIVLAMICSKSKVKGREVNWKEDRWFTYPLWTEGYKTVVKPKLKELGLVPGIYWLKMSFTPDPSGRTRDVTNQETGETEQKVDLLAFPTEKYASEAEAESKAPASSTSTAHSPSAPQQTGNSNVPPGYQKDVWEQMIPFIKDAVKGGKPPAVVASEYGVDVKFIASAMA